jgi:hypothetical protein
MKIDTHEETGISANYDFDHASCCNSSYHEYAKIL